ncbi:hypothetical protein ACQPZZ_24450 [Microbispora sp. CA-135349]|uniref:hypothetical protein n=1 Tax=Microbispora sp. CA-135349 TaxID=3239953 RepID=UPI003D90FDE3
MRKSITLPVEDVDSFQFDQEDSTLYFAENRYDGDPVTGTPLGGHLYRMGETGTAEVIATERNAGIGVIAVRGGTLAYASFAAGKASYDSESNLHVVKNGEEVRRVYVGAIAVLGLSLAPDGSIGVTTHDLGAGGTTHVFVVPRDKTGLGDGVEVSPGGDPDCRLSGITWVGEQWVALEDRLEWGGGKCRDGAHLVAIRGGAGRGAVMVGGSGVRPSGESSMLAGSGCAR